MIIFLSFSFFLYYFSYVLTFFPLFIIYYYLLILFDLLEPAENKNLETSKISSLVTFWYELFWYFLSNISFHFILFYFLFLFYLFIFLFGITLACHANYTIVLILKNIEKKKKCEILNKTILEYSHELPTTDSSTSYSCPRKRNLEVLESH